MARIRTLKPDFWGHPKTAQVSRDARLLFLGMLNESDDEGRQLGAARRIAGAVFPNDDDVTPKMVGRWLDELEQARFLVRYEVEGVTYISINGFDKHQKISHPAPSRLPSPSGHPPEKNGSGSGGPHDALRSSSAPYLGSGSRNLEIPDPDGSPPASATQSKSPRRLSEAKAALKQRAAAT